MAAFLAALAALTCLRSFSFPVSMIRDPGAGAITPSRPVSVIVATPSAAWRCRMCRKAAGRRVARSGLGSQQVRMAQAAETR